MKYPTLVIYSDFDAEIKDIKKKYFIASDYNKFMNNILDAKITAKKLVNKSGLNEKINTLAKREEIKLLATKTELKAEQNKIVKLETYELLVKVTLSMMEHDFT